MVSDFEDKQLIDITTDEFVRLCSFALMGCALHYSVNPSRVQEVYRQYLTSGLSIEESFTKVVEEFSRR